jgi:hypothetical protein
MTEDERIAREAIRKTITDYTIAGDSRDAALFNGLWTEAAEFHFAGFPPVPGFHCEGLDDIHRWTAAWDRYRDAGDASVRKATFARHNLTTCHIELTGPDAARARTFFMVVTDIGLDHTGTYTDTLARRGERWLFERREIALDWRAADSIYPALKSA